MHLPRFVFYVICFLHFCNVNAPSMDKVYNWPHEDVSDKAAQIFQLDQSCDSDGDRCYVALILKG